MNVDIEFSQFELKKCHFDHDSILHGIKHTYRVMAHTLILGHLIHARSEGNIAFFAAFIHDMARRHDGLCTAHGQWAVESKLDDFTKVFYANGLHERDINTLKIAVENHSQPGELPSLHPSYTTTALLKDADALDRIRLGSDNLDPKYLRFRISRKLIPYATDLFYATNYINIRDFNQIWYIATLILENYPRLKTNS